MSTVPPPLPTTIRGWRDDMVNHSNLLHDPDRTDKRWAVERRIRDEDHEAWAHMVNAHAGETVYAWCLAYALAVIAKYVPEGIADAFAADLTLACEAGDSFGEWAWQWREEITAGGPMTLPFEETEADD